MKKRARRFYSFTRAPGLSAAMISFQQSYFHVSCVSRMVQAGRASTRLLFCGGIGGIVGPEIIIIIIIVIIIMTMSD